MSACQPISQTSPLCICRTSSAPFRSAEDFPKHFRRKWPLTLVYVFSGLKFKAPRVPNLRASLFIKFLLREYVSWVKPKFWFEFRQLFVKQCYLSDELFLTNVVFIGKWLLFRKFENDIEHILKCVLFTEVVAFGCQMVSLLSPLVILMSSGTAETSIWWRTVHT